MSTGLKWIVALVVIIIAGVMLWQSGLVSLSAPPALPAETASSTPQSGLPTAQSDTSDAALVQDSAAIDAQLTGMSQDSAAVDQSFTDQPVQQSY